MAYFDWTEWRVDHIAAHDVTIDEFEHIFDCYEEQGISGSSGRRMRWGYTPAGRYLAIVFEWEDDYQTVVPVTAYDAKD